MNKYIRKLFGVVFQSQQTQQIFPLPLQPLPTSPEEWRQYWQAKGFPWRTEPEIDEERQKYLEKYLTVIQDEELEGDPFDHIVIGRTDIEQITLSRADIEWLLASSRDGPRSGESSNEQLQKHYCLDLQGVVLRQVDLRGFPLGRVNLAEARLEGARLSGVNLENAVLIAAHLEGATLIEAHLEGARISDAILEGVDLTAAHLEGADLSEACLENADLSGAHLQKADLTRAYLEKANLSEAHLEGATLGRNGLESEDADLPEVYRELNRQKKADPSHIILSPGPSYLEGANLFRAHLEGADLTGAYLGKADLSEAHMEGANLTRAHLEGADLQFVFFDNATRLDGAVLGDEKRGFVLLADVRWSGINLSVVDWTSVKMLGDEIEAHKIRKDDRKTRLYWYRRAVRANRQLAIALEGQGLKEDAARFAYRAQILQRKVLWKQRNFWKWLGSAILALLAGYGYRMWRILAAYLLIVLLCAVAYFVLGMYYGPHLSFLEAVLTSVTAFHGRVFSEPFLHPGAPQLWVTAFEAVMGLVVEGVFIAMLAQKFFGK